MQPPPRNNHSAFELKGSLFTLTVLHLLNTDIDAFTSQLKQHAQKTPHLFKNMPLVIDLQKVVDQNTDIDFKTLQYQLRAHGLIPVGIRHGNEKLNQAAELEGLAILSNPSSKAKPAQSQQPAISLIHTQVITTPVRSGQQIYARQKNLVILAQVSAGAEILADGSIHVYDVLRGRALAGVSGDKSACIFCHKLNAELVSIAGHYLLSDSLPDIDAPMIQVFLKEDHVCVTGLPMKR
jgi:septum site-determining protein MinC